MGPPSGKLYFFHVMWNIARYYLLMYFQRIRKIYRLYIPITLILHPAAWLSLFDAYMKKIWICSSTRPWQIFWFVVTRDFTELLCVFSDFQSRNSFNKEQNHRTTCCFQVNAIRMWRVNPESQPEVRKPYNRFASLAPVSLSYLTQNKLRWRREHKGFTDSTTRKRI